MPVDHIGSVSYSEYAPLEDGLPAGKRWVTFESDVADTEALLSRAWSRWPARAT